MFYAIQDGDKYVLRFQYDTQLIDIVKQVPGREWVAERKYWTIPTAHLGWLMKGIKGTPYEHALEVHSEEHLNENASLDSTYSIPDIDISDMKLYVKQGYKLYDHQIAFLKYAKSKGTKGFILADDMGCVAGDTEISLHINGSNVYHTIEHLYDRIHFPVGKGRFDKNALIEARCCDPETHMIMYEEILDVVQSGVKLVYELTLSIGYKLKLTADHKVLTEQGYVEAQHLNHGDIVCVNGHKRYRLAEVRSITKLKPEMTYDIKLVGPNHNFLANNIFIHNCGKTLEVLNYAMYQRKQYRYKHCLIIACVNSAKYSWQEDIDKHTNGTEQAYILGSRIVSRGKRKGQFKFNTTGQDKVDDLVTGHMYGDPNAPKLPYFIVTNIESLLIKEKIKSKMFKDKYIFEETLIQLIINGDIGLIAIDECHKNMSPQSLQGKLILDIKKRTGKAAQWIPMTGTPIKNKPTDVYTPLKLVNGHGFKSFYQWNEQFCIMGGYGNHEILGYKNIPLLKDMLQGNMIRRMKSEVLDLPPKIYYNEYVENTPTQQQLYQDIVDELYSQKDEILESINPLAAMLRLRQVNGSPELVDSSIPLDDKYIHKNAKLARLLELIDDVVERDEKVIVFSNWVEPLRTIYKYLSKKHKTCCYTGTMSEADREKHKQVFIKNPNYKVMLGTIGAMGVSLTLTVATNVIFYDDCWTPADKEQAEDRANRIGSTEPLKVYTIMSKGTIDERVRQILEQKKGIASYIVDDQIDLKQHPELFEFLLGMDK
jgi:hypothetical protein